MIVVIGRIQTRSWEGQDGKKNYATEVVASEVSFGDSKKESDAASAVQNEGFKEIDTQDDLPF